MHINLYLFYSVAIVIIQILFTVSKFDSVRRWIHAAQPDSSLFSFTYFLLLTSLKANGIPFYAVDLSNGSSRQALALSLAYSCTSTLVSVYAILGFWKLVTMKIRVPKMSRPVTLFLQGFTNIFNHNTSMQLAISSLLFLPAFVKVTFLRAVGMSSTQMIIYSSLEILLSAVLVQIERLLPDIMSTTWQFELLLAGMLLLTASMSLIFFIKFKHQIKKPDIVLEIQQLSSSNASQIFKDTDRNKLELEQSIDASREQLWHQEL